MQPRRVVVTGLGVVSPVGNNVSAAWSALLAGRSGVGPITRFDATEYDTRIAGEVKDFDPAQYMDRRLARRLDRYQQFALVATQEAVADAKVETSSLDPRRVGVVIASGIGGINTLIQELEILRERGPRRVGPFGIPLALANSAAAQVSIALGVRGPCLAPATACAAGTHALGEAAAIIRRGDADVMIAGGSESALVPITVAAFVRMRATSRRNDEPERACRPFDVSRDGFVLAEGAAIVVLEDLGSAVARGAHIYGELVGYGATSDAYHIAAPPEDGIGATEAMQRALETAGLSPATVDYINAHGTGTPLNDVIETRAIKAAFGKQAYEVAVSSSKSMTGHMLGAAGAFEAIVTLLAMRDQILPPTINLEHPDPECDLDYVPNEPRQAHVDVAMSNSFGLGGVNASLLFRRMP